MFFRERRAESRQRRLPVLPLRDTVVFPHLPLSVTVGRPASLAAVQAAWSSASRELLAVAQVHADCVDPRDADLHRVGAVAYVAQVVDLPDGKRRVVLDGRRRAERGLVETGANGLVAEVTEWPSDGEGPSEDPLLAALQDAFEHLAALRPAIPPEMVLSVRSMADRGRLADVVVGPLQLPFAERQRLLECGESAVRAERVLRFLRDASEGAEVERKVRDRVQRDKEAGEREAWLADQARRQQRDTPDAGARGELEELTERLAARSLPPAVRDRATRELKRLGQMAPLSAEASVVRGYLDWIVDLPWTEVSAALPPRELLTVARRTLDEDHFGLRRVKDALLEHLAVSVRVERPRGPVLCLVGPPGVGKTSLARSLARAAGRPFVRVSLGGVRDEAEIRGHRRTYIGAMPGKVVHALKRAGTLDPVVLLDEIDKLAHDFRGDPAAALLEVLDPEQNTAFQDHYLDLDLDVSRVTFVCTANTLQGVPAALHDRLEVIEVPGYSVEQKFQIARSYLVPRQRTLAAVDEAQLRWTDQALLRIIEDYTRESGVRDLERQIGRVTRKVARRLTEEEPSARYRIDTRNLERALGVPRYRRTPMGRVAEVGVVRGLGVSPWGGEVLDIEVVCTPGKGGLTLTGRLGDWLKESGQAALGYVRAHAAALSLDLHFCEKYDFHIHYPGNVLPTDGPSAGVAMAIGLVSAATGRPVRSDTAVTGEVSLRGRVLRIGGLKEKLLAARRAGLARVLIPESNLADLAEIPLTTQESLEIIGVSHMNDVLAQALSAVKSERIFVEGVSLHENVVESCQADRPPESGSPEG
jgi:ATP-dependent Lon protease